MKIFDYFNQAETISFHACNFHDNKIKSCEMTRVRD